MDGGLYSPVNVLAALSVLPRRPVGSTCGAQCPCDGCTAVRRSAASHRGPLVEPWIHLSRRCTVVERPLNGARPGPTGTRRDGPKRADTGQDVEPSRPEPSPVESSRVESSRAEPSRAKPSRAEPSRAEPSRAEPSRAEPSRAEPSRAEPSRAEPSRAEPSRTEPSRAEPSRAEPSRAEPSRTKP